MKRILSTLVALSLSSQAEVRKEFYENGQVELEENYENGVRHGEARSYFESGKLEAQLHYVNG